MNLSEYCLKKLEVIKQQGLKRFLRTLDTPQGPRIRIDNKQCLNFCSNDYLGLANDPRIKNSALAAINEFGIGSGASRLISGTNRLHKELEERIACFKHAQRALVFNSGYAANLGIISCLCARNSFIFSDRANHASIVDAIVLSRAKLIRYGHNNIAMLRALLSKAPLKANKFIVTDSVFSMDGDCADLSSILSLCKEFQAFCIIDEAHATGVFGPCGEGLAEELKLSADIDVAMGTFSKALGSFGAFVTASDEVIEYLINSSRPFIYTTSLPAAIAASNIEAIEIVSKEPERRKKLWENIGYLKAGLVRLKLDLIDSNSAIIPILIKDNLLTMKFSSKLLDKGIFIQGVRPPAVGSGEARLRLTVTSEHSKDDLDQALCALKHTGKQLGII